MFSNLPAVSAVLRRGAFAASVCFGVFSAIPLAAQSSFDVATIRPSSGEVKFERNGEIEVAYGTLRMHDVTVGTCIHWAYSLPLPLIYGPSSLKDVHYDIVAKTESGATDQQMRLMMRSLLSERFGLQFHAEKRELRVYTLVVSKGGIKMHPSAPGGKAFRQNSASGMVARSLTMQELADYLSDPLGAVLTDGTGIKGAYDFAIDFTPYVDQERSDVRPDPAAVLGSALKGELGLELVQGKREVDVTVVDHVDPPTSN
jgi:uncharacterized protein (TIGR03435 family)